MSTVIKVENLSKRYRLGVFGGKTLREDVQRWWAKLRGKPDPLVPVGQNGQAVGENGYVWALRDVSFDVKEGEVLGIIGRNGAGKSTLLKLLTRITAPTSGRVRMKGRVASMLEVGTGFHPELTGRENVFLNGAILGMTKADVERKFDEIVEFSGVAQYIDTPVKRYSSGMRVRLAFAVAAHLDPEILLIDEVLAVGDIAFQQRCLGKMEGVAKEGRTVLFVSHNMASITELCDRTLLLSNGTIMDDGETASVIQTYVSSGILEQPRFVQEADPDKPIHLREVRVLDEHGQCSAEMRYDQAIRVKIDYDVNEPVSNCGVAFSLRTLDEIRVFTTADYDADPGMIQARASGSYTSIVDIPARWLKPNQYKLVVFVSQLERGGHVYDKTETVAFNVIDNGTPYKRHGTSERKAVLQPIFSWKTARIEHAAPV